MAPYNCPLAELWPRECKRLAPTEFMTGIAPDAKTAIVMNTTKVGAEKDGPMSTRVLARTSAENWIAASVISNRSSLRAEWMWVNGLRDFIKRTIALGKVSERVKLRRCSLLLAHLGVGPVSTQLERPRCTRRSSPAKEVGKLETFSAPSSSSSSFYLFCIPSKHVLRIQRFDRVQALRYS